MDPQRLSGLKTRAEEFDDRLTQLLKSGVDPRSAEFDAFVCEVHAWLKECVTLGILLAPGSPIRRMMQGLIDYWTSRLLRHGRTYADVDRLMSFDSHAGEPLPDDRFPYHGLLAVTDPKRLFGRDAEVADYVQHLEQHTALLIQSESGGGKSSVAIAGVLPKLQQRHPEWVAMARITPGLRPAETLHSALAEACRLPRDMRLDAAAVRTALSGRTLLLFIDQLEELLTMCNDTKQQEAFSDLISDLADTCGAKVLATLRIDHYERLANSSACHALYSLLTRDGSVKTLASMSVAQIRSVIQQPADAVGLRFVPASIVERLASESANAPGGLPLLQFALQRLWYERPRDKVTGEPFDFIDEATYAKLPTLQSAIGTVAQSYFDELSDRGLVEAGKRLLLELTVIDERIEVPLRRRRNEAELLDVLAGARLATTDQARLLIDGFIERRVMVRTGSGESAQIEVAHEALFRHWKQFQYWFQSEEVKMTLKGVERVSRDAVLWEQGAESADLLKLKGQPLANAIRLRDALWLDSTSSRYVDACEDAAAEQARRDAEAAAAVRQAKKNRKYRLTSVALAILVVIVFLFSVRSSNLKDERANAAAINAAALVSDLNALDALDLAYTMRHISAAPLAHAIDRMEGAEMMFPRKEGGADFTPRGSAVAQYVRPDPKDSNGKISHVRIKPLGGHLQPWEQVIQIPLALKDGEELATLDVGPRLSPGQNFQRITAGAGPTTIGSDNESATGPDSRLVTASFYLKNSPEGLWTRMVVWRITEGNDKVERLANLLYPKGTRKASDIAYGPGGSPTAMLLWKSDGLLPDAMWVWDDAEVSAEPKERLVEASDGARITSVVLRKNGESVLGRDDGSVQCLGVRESIIRSTDTSPVSEVHVSADSSMFVAVHESNGLTVDDCSRTVSGPEITTIPLATQPRNVVLHASKMPQEPGHHILTYVAAGLLNCRYIGPAAAPLPQSGAQPNHQNPCWVPEWPLSSAYPIFDGSGELNGYLALADLTVPLLRRLHKSAPGDRLQPTRGLPVGHIGEEGNDQFVAVSPHDRYSAEIVRQKDGQLQIVFNKEGQRITFEVLKTSQFAISQRITFKVFRKSQFAINERGTAVMLGPASNGATCSGSPAGQGTNAIDQVCLTVIRANGRREPEILVVDKLREPSCLKLSPDGKKVVVAGRTLDAQVFAVEAGHSGASGRVRRDDDYKGAGLTACAIGDDAEGTVVLATRDGMVWLSESAKAKLKPVSELVAFRLDAPALDVSIDSSSRFVAVIGTRTKSKCLNGMGGHPLRIWDLQSKRPDLPVASTCLAGEVQAIGALEQKGLDWVLPVFERKEPVFEREKPELLRFDYKCLACEAKGGYDAVEKRLEDKAKQFQAEELTKKLAIELYGFKP